MRSLFSQPSEGPAEPTGSDKASGWNGLAGWKKIAVIGVVFCMAAAVVVLPGMGAHPPVPIVQEQQHEPLARIKDYNSPPPAADIGTRISGGQSTPAAPVLVRKVPVATEMELYAGPAGALGKTDPGASSAAGGVQQASIKSDDGTEGTSYATVARNRSYTIRAGEVIPCLPIDAQDSSRTGYTSCRVPEWFRSSDQRRGLLPPGTKIFGRITSGISNGQRRLGVVYTRIETPEFNMALSAPGADEMGRAGLDGDVHTFFWEKAGAVALYALMDLVVDSGQNLASSALQNSFLNRNGGTSLQFNSQGDSLAQEEMQQTANRPPILTRDQALPITATVGQDLDFSEACRLAMTVNPMACPLQ